MRIGEKLSWRKSWARRRPGSPARSACRSRALFREPGEGSECSPSAWYFGKSPSGCSMKKGCSVQERRPVCERHG